VTTPAVLLKTLNHAGVTLSRAGDKLKFKALRGALTADLKAEIIAHKPALMEMIGPCPACGWHIYRGRCFACGYRLCMKCRTRTTGSVFIALCMSCGLRDEGSG
jgi:hypothetical protein